MHSLETNRLLYQQALQARDKQPLVVVGLGTCGIAAGGEKVWQSAYQELYNLNLDASMMSTGCIGMCYAEPIIEVHLPGKPRVIYGNVTPEQAEAIIREHVAGGQVYMPSVLAQVSNGKLPYAEVPELSEIPFYRKQVKTVLNNCGIIDPDRLEEYVAYDGYLGLETVLTKMSSAEVINEVKLSGLRGRGGGGFPTGQKWELAAASPGDKKYVICNADEGDPGAFMDRSVFEG